jgi:5-methylcytosine-specific restriction endonuclease McrA
LAVAEMTDNKLYELAAEIERLRAALEAIRDTPRRDGVLTCQRIAVEALNGGKQVLKPKENSLGDPLYFREVIQYLHWRYKSRCVYCQGDENLQIDHLYPVSRGGSDDIGNLVLACSNCNKAKGAMTSTEFGFSEIHLLAAGSSLHGWRKVAADQERSHAQIGEALRRMKADE